MRAIDGDTLIEKYGDWYTEEGTEEGYIGTIKGIVNRMPTIEPERKTGKWVRALDGNDGHVRCSQCMKIYDWDVQAQYYGYCPKCGSDNREEGDTP